MKTALREEKLNIAVSLVNVKFQGMGVNTESLVINEIAKGHGNKKVWWYIHVPHCNYVMKRKPRLHDGIYSRKSRQTRNAINQPQSHPIEKCRI